MTTSYTRLSIEIPIGAARCHKDNYVVDICVLIYGQDVLIYGQYRLGNCTLAAMPLYEPIVHIRYMRPLLIWAEEIAPGSAAKLLRELDFGHLLRGEGDRVLTLAQCDALLNAVTENLDRSDVGFELGCRIGLDDHGLLGVVLRQSCTMDEAVRMVVRYYRLITPSFSASFHRSHRQGEYYIRPAGPMSHRGLHQALEVHAVAAWRSFNDLLGDQAVTDIHVSIDPPPHLARYRSLAPTRFHFAPGPRPEVRCVFPLDVLDRPLQQPGAKTDEATRTSLEEALFKFRPGKHYSGWARMMLREAETVQPTLADLAELLGMSPRQLTRHLTAEGQNLREIGKQVRFERACTMLRDESYSLGLIAHRLGYRSTANFITAFRTMGGTTPEAFRKRTRR
jgi:AraC-like DNA-binding protein